MVSQSKKRKKHDTSNWNYSSLIRRAFRHSKDGPEVTGPKRPKRNKLICKQTGKAHRAVNFDQADWRWPYYKHCADCGKVFDHWELNKLRDYIRKIENVQSSSE